MPIGIIMTMPILSNLIKELFAVTFPLKPFQEGFTGDVHMNQLHTRRGTRFMGPIVRLIVIFEFGIIKTVAENASVPSYSREPALSIAQVVPDFCTHEGALISIMYLPEIDRPN